MEDKRAYKLIDNTIFLIQRLHSFYPGQSLKDVKETLMYEAGFTPEEVDNLLKVKGSFIKHLIKPRPAIEFFDDPNSIKVYIRYM